MWPYLYYGVLLPFVFYVLPAGLIYYLFTKFYIQRLPSVSSQKLFLTSMTGKFLTGFFSLLVVLLIWAILVFVFKIGSNKIQR